MRMFRLALMALALLIATPLIVTPLPASAHLMPAKNGTIHIVGDSAYNVIGIPEGAIAFADDNHDRLIEPDELRAHNDAIVAAFRRDFVLTDRGQPGKAVLVYLMMPQTGGEAVNGSAYILAMQRVNFAVAPTDLRVSTHLFDAQMGQLSLSARYGDKADMLVLTPEHTTARLFRSPLQSFIDFIATGVLHILTGPDHLLFLLTIIAGLKTWRQWFSVTIAFTIAHSITLSLSVLGIFSLPAAWVEPAIAASIVIVALDNLRRGDQAVKQRMIIVFACGLVHGLGFASAITGFGLDLPHRLASLAGFNLGVEIGQFGFIALILSLMAAIRSATGRHWRPALWQSATSCAAAGIGGLFLISRLW